MRGFVCKVCKYVSIDGGAPEKCPVCGAPQTAFEGKEDAINTPVDAGNLTEAEKKHIPVITVVKECGLIPDGCTDLHVKLGEIKHPMQVEHFIGHIDFYINNEYLARVMLTPEKLNPAAALHLNVSGGKLTAVALCNVHGAWINEQEL